ncbi:hypothetical protein VTP01DRAFT_8101 [Rhizomucor pusillus]|uniref:uncharacterized protein n=1 Tax=Rhizomucor pusillus TaxID=4840 RepID=UPI0037435A6E
MSSTEYGAVNNQVDEEARVTEQRESGGQRSRLHKVRDTLHLHGHRIFAAWIIIIATAAVLTLSFHFSLLNRDKSSEDQDSLLEDQCVSDRSWFVALLLSIFFGPFGIDRFYLGYILLGILKLLTAGLGGIWWIVDVVLIALNVLTDHPNGCHLH